MAKGNIFTEEKQHAAKDGTHKALCGASGNDMRRVLSTSQNVTCLRCLRILHAKKRQGKPLIEIL